MSYNGIFIFPKCLLLRLQQKLQTVSKRTKQFHVKGKMETLKENQPKKPQIMKFVVDRHKRTPTDQTVLGMKLHIVN